MPLTMTPNATDEILQIFNAAQDRIVRFHNGADILTNLQTVEGVLPAIGQSVQLLAGPFDQSAAVRATTIRLQQLFAGVISDDDGTLSLDLGQLEENFSSVYADNNNLIDQVTALLDGAHEDGYIGGLVEILEILNIVRVNVQADIQSFGKMAAAHSHYIFGLLGPDLYGRNTP